MSNLLPCSMTSAILPIPISLRRQGSTPRSIHMNNGAVASLNRKTPPSASLSKKSWDRTGSVVCLPSWTAPLPARRRQRSPRLDARATRTYGFRTVYSLILQIITDFYKFLVCSFSAGSTPIFATKYSFCIILRDPNVSEFKILQNQRFSQEINVPSYTGA